MKSLIAALLLLPIAYAGNTDGGGGRGLVCYNDDNSIKSVELLDLFEGRILEGLIPIESNDNPKNIIKEVISQSPNNFINLLTTFSLSTFDNFKFLPEGMRLKPINDSGEIFIPATCKIEQLAHMQGRNVYVVGDFWKKMNNVNKAALGLHEMLWAWDRTGGRIFSKRARRNVARYFAKEYTFTKKTPSNVFGNISCASHNLDHQVNKISIGTRFNLNPKDSGYQLEFSNIGGTFLHNNHFAQIDYANDHFEDILKEFYTAQEVRHYHEESEEFTFSVFQQNSGPSFTVTVNSSYEKQPDGSFKKKIVFRALDDEFPDKIISESALNCWHDSDDNDVSDVTSEFLSSHLFTYTEDSNFKENIAFLDNAQFAHSMVRHVGREGSTRIPLGTTCGYKEIFQVIKVSKRNNPTPDSRGLNPTHFLMLKPLGFIHDDQIHPESSTNIYCQTNLAESNSTIGDDTYPHAITALENSIIFEGITFTK